MTFCAPKPVSSLAAPPAPAPMARIANGAPICLANVMALWVVFLTFPPSSSATTSVPAMSDHLRFRLELRHELLHVLHLHAGRALRRHLGVRVANLQRRV